MFDEGCGLMCVFVGVVLCGVFVLSVFVFVWCARVCVVLVLFVLLF